MRVRIEAKNTTMKNIEVYVSDVVLRVNITDRKVVKTIDLFKEVKLEA